ncbi:MULTISPECIES: heme NO-binding domain-containing protein [Haloferax]|uniref:Heme NO-binding protein n=2 Tax=Haloferax TaxID=2251 RepID=A0A6G1YYD8_9EURY|nr:MULTISPECIES: heme NO-binding domain-containing protein [Haloferax]KAB1186627.1 heme NO-binding protein [Haloferax sp. CBA1149]MRW79245.1 heme NO-binding protein [Haloferax marinisediminis]
MHGIVLNQLKSFVVETYDRDTWATLQQEAGLPGKLYVPVTEYPDEDVLALVETASELTEIPIPDLLEAFGEFLVPPLLETYGVHVDKDWTGLELIANVERYIHIALRAKQVSTYTPPELESGWRDNNTVSLVYQSDRQLCHLARGIITGVGDHFDEPFEIEEPVCMHEGDEYCELLVRHAEAA